MYNLRQITEKFKADRAYRGSVKVDEIMAPYTTMRIGGAAPLYLEPKDEASLERAIKVLKEEDVPCTIFGGGSNVIISDEGFDGAVISLRAISSISARIDKSAVKVHSSTPPSDFFTVSKKPVPVVVSVAAGTNWGSVISFCREHAILGFEAFSGLPGSAGGAIFMNASCFGHAACDNLLSARIYKNGGIINYRYSDDGWGYKKSPFQNDTGIILSAEFLCFCAHKDFLSKPEYVNTRIKGWARNIFANTVESRQSKGHYKSPSAGSIFKNNPDFGASTGKIIDECGLKGYISGGAQIAPWHGNIIINNGGAKASDIKAIVNHVKAVVKEKKGFDLDCEIVFLGKWDS